jgi:hypothetical protein
MLTHLYIEALLADPEAADAVWEAWWDGELSDFVAAWAWWKIALNRVATSGLTVCRLAPRVLQPIHFRGQN